MREIIFAAALAVFTVLTGCATGIRVGGDRYGAGVGGYVGPVPAAVAAPAPGCAVPLAPPP